MEEPIDVPFRLTWKWKVDSIFPAVPHQKTRDDYAARVYIVFQKRWNERALNYVLTDKHIQITHWENPYSIDSIMLPRTSALVNRWEQQTALPFADYQLVFNEKPGKVIAIALMSDTDDTGGHVEAWYRDFNIEILP